MSVQVVPTNSLKDLGVTSPKLAASVGVTGNLSAGGDVVIGGNYRFGAANSPETICKSATGILRVTAGMQIDSTVGVGTPPANNVGVYITGNLNFQQTGQYGIFCNPTITTAATAGAYGIYTSLVTANNLATSGLNTIAAGPPTLGSGTSATNINGLYVANQGAAGVTNAYGVYVVSQAGASGVNFGMYVNYTSALTGGPYAPGSAVFNNTSTGNGTASLITISCGGYNQWGVGFGTIYGLWWHAFIASSQIQWGFDGSRLRLASDTGWNALTFQNGWTNYSSPYGPAGYRKMPDGIVLLRGLVQGGTAGVICTLPAGFRPAQTQLVVAAINGPGVLRLDVTSAGNVQTMELLSGVNSMTGWISLNNIAFLAEG